MTERYRDPAVPRAERVDDLLARMSVPEKVGQLNQRLLGWHTWTLRGAGIATTRELDDELERFGGIGAVYGLLRADAWSGRDWSTGADPALSREVAAQVQERVVAGNRLGIPALFVEEAVHGHQALGAQLLPVGVALAATWRPDLVEEAFAQVGAELRARGVHLALVSGLDLLRDPRWGRAEETFGEDPLLSSLLTRATVRGVQSEPGLGVVLKHFAGQGAGIGGRNSSGAPLGPRELREIHLPAARAGIDEGALGVMAAYNDLDGIPCIANPALLTGVLREEWGFDGVVMADMFAIDRLMRAAPSAAHAGALALRAGVDLSMCDVSYAALEEAVDLGLASIDDLDRAVRRVLDLKVRLGLLDPPSAAPSFPAPRDLDELVAAGAVLLKDRTGMLPLLPSRHLAVIGPNADDLGALLGDYVPPLADDVGSTVLAGLAALMSSPPTFERGSGWREDVEGGLERAVALAAAADAVVLVVGSTSARDYADDFQSNGAAALGGAIPIATSGEGYDLAEVRVPEAQLRLARAVAATGTPVVAIVVSGRPLGIDELAGLCDALIWIGFPGPDGGRMLAELLLGRREPRGRLPFSSPGSSGALPVAYNERLETTVRYVDREAMPSFPFGAGRGWSTADVGTATASTARCGAGDLARLRVTASIRGTGSQLVQLFARARVPGILPRRAVLVGFRWVELGPGEERTVEVAVDADAVPGLGLPKAATIGGTLGELDLWLTVDGATVGHADPSGATTVVLSP